ncbi:IclR family transcriptional regulator [Pseudonocardia sp. TRM90224]|uniref:IclR family transcriptional regulator n=1 Tax=Pseudonocardia sp. TRM90224 TaxID=2812678 RepID=UPI001E55FA01|nr:IclR family transcriptional regulator [Pseudonocardia sp. TRM90224]
MRNKPAYGIESVDHALRLAVLLQREGPQRVTDVAERLGVARSTAHRLLAMLVYHDFAEQDSDRRYIAGPALRGTLPADAGHEHLRAAALPHLRTLVERSGETANLTVLLGDQVLFIATVECTHVLRVGDREGRTLPAHLTSGGKVLLARRPPAEIAAAYAGTAVDVPALQRALRQVRKQEFGVNNQATEAGVTAIGCAITDTAAVSLAMPTARYSRDRVPEWVALLRETAERIAGTL